MSGFIFFDLETSGLNKAFDQILQFAAIYTNRNLEIVDRLSIRCRLLPHVVPSPKALALTGTTPAQLVDTAFPSHYEMIMQVREKLAEWSPATFLGWNSISFDEELLRRALYTTLNKPYLTNTNGNNRTDALTIARAAHYTAPGQINISTKSNGQPDFTLASVAAANGYEQHRTHDAEGDVEATLFICRLIKERVPDAWSAAARFARKDEAFEFLDQNETVALVSYWDKEHRPPLVSRLGQNSEQINQQYLFNLSHDPNALTSCSDEELELQLSQSNPVVIRMRINAAPVFFYPDEIPPEMLRAPADIGVQEARAESLRSNPLLMERLVNAANATAWKAEKSEHVELQIYDGFTQDPDWQVAEEFHNIDWHKRIETSAQFRDPRLRRLARRLQFFEAPQFMEPHERQQIVSQLQKRVRESGSPGLWRTIPEAVNEARELASTLGTDLSDIVSFLEQQEQKIGSLGLCTNTPIIEEH